jgi:hypothetical protein
MAASRSGASMPFCSGMTVVSGRRSGGSLRQRQNSTRSTTPISAGLAVAFADQVDRLALAFDAEPIPPDGVKMRASSDKRHIIPQGKGRAKRTAAATRTHDRAAHGMPPPRSLFGYCPFEGAYPD